MKNTHIKPGDTVTRMLAGQIAMPLKVTKVDETCIYCGDWKFDRETGMEIDDMLGWTKSSSGSYLQTTGLGNEIEQKRNEDGIF